MTGRIAAAVAAKWVTNSMRYPLQPRRCYATATSGGSSTSADATAMEMINYARLHSRSQNATSYQEALRVLEQGLSIFQGTDESTANAAGRLLLTMGTLYTDRGDIKGAFERLNQASEMTFSSLEVKVAALEAITGLHLRMHQDDAASKYGDRCLHLLESADIKMDKEKFQSLNMRARAIKGLVELACGHVDSAESYFAGCNIEDIRTDKNGLGAVALSHAEFAHVGGKFALAKQFYELALELSGTKDSLDMQVPATVPMVSEDVLLGAVCGLGQLATHTGKFDEAEQKLTEVLKKAEEFCGGHNWKVGIVLSCIADMFGRRGQSEGANYFFIQEGLYRRALEMLKAPPLEQQVSQKEIDLRDVVALTRGGYAQLLSHQHNRVGEAQKMRGWADAVWSNSRTSLVNVLENTETSNYDERKRDATVVTDLRFGRVF